MHRSAMAAVLLAAFAPAVAHADCALPESSIIWSYPAQGETGVPTTVDLWVLASGWGGSPRAFLNGAELSRLAFGNGYELGELEPDTSYTVQLGAPEDDVRFERSFTTGAGPAAPDPAAAPGDVSVVARSASTLSPLCRAALATQDCFDTGQNTYYVFEPSGTAKAWLVQSASTFRGVDLWPAECGAPQLFLHSSTLPCATLYGIDAAGATHAGEEMCSGATGDVLGGDEGDGCSLRTRRAPSRPLLGAMGIAALALAALRRRRRVPRVS